MISDYVIRTANLQGNNYRITYNKIEDIEFITVDIHCKFLFFSWWKTIKYFYINDLDDEEYQTMEANELLDFIINPHKA